MKKLGPVLLTVLLDLLGFGLVIPLVPYYAEEYGASAQTAMALMGIYSLAQFLFAPVWGSLSDRVGRRPVMLFSIAGTAFFLACFALAPNLPALFAFRFLHGACAANISTAQAYVADVTTPEDRAMGMGLIGASFGVGFTLGPWVGGELAGRYDLSAPIWLAAALSTINLLWAAWGLPESRPIGEKGTAKRVLDPGRIWKALQHPIVGSALALTFAATFAFTMMEVSFGLVAEHEWFPDLTREAVAMRVGRLFGLIGIIGIVIQGGLIGRLVARFGEPLVIVSGFLITSAGMASLAMTDEGSRVWLACIPVALGHSMASPSLQALISRAVDADSQGSIMGVNQSLSAFARATGPWLAVALFGYASSAPFVASAVFMLLATALALPATRRAKAAQGAPVG